MDDPEWIQIWRGVIADPATSWVLFDQGTCVLLRQRLADPAAEAKALLRASGPVLAASTAGDFSVLELEGGRGWVVGSHHPDIVTLVVPQEIDADAPAVAVGLLGRAKREKDAERLRVRHVEDRRGTAAASAPPASSPAGQGHVDAPQDEAAWRMLAALAGEQRFRLHSLSGLLDLLEDPEFDDVEERRKLLTAGSAAVRELLGALDTVLDGTRLRLERVEPWLEPFSPARLVEEVVAWLGPAAERRGGVLRSRKSPATEQQWFALDRQRLQMVLREICLSASGFWFGTASGAEVVLAATVEEPPAGPPRPVFEVVATGGTDLQDLAEQLARPPTPEGLVADAFSSGRIGLFLCRRLLEVLGGTLDLEAIDGGCRFAIRVPADAVSAPTDRPAGPSPISAWRAMCWWSRTIRAQRLGDARHLPIVGLRLAVPSTEAREPCAGQDAVLMKPVNGSALYDALQRWLGIAPDGAASRPARSDGRHRRARRRRLSRPAGC